MNTTPTTEDRVWTVLSHLSALSFGMGILLPVVGWSDQRRKSNYATFQSLQALGYQSVGFTVWVLSFLVITIVGAIIFLAAFGSVGGESEASTNNLAPVVIAVSAIIFGFFALYFVLPIIAAIACALGKDFRYPLLGDRLAQYLEYDSAQKSEVPSWLNEDHEFRWVAAMGHFSILIMLWGMLAPLTAWILQGRNHRFLKFQSIQTLVFQALTTIIYLIGGFSYFVGLFALVAAMGGFANAGSDSMGTITLVVLGIALLISFVLILSIPFLHILGQWAGYRILKGENYRYPWIGKLVERWISKNSTLKEKPT